ncbi:hypothetical protein GSI_04653 [Ganoderma sinense ZZ0214-1]|uniref:Uncharacterized protein n=1 Tax=Ganoderma sinense ZZ0214-1 TaxID=1077348 RepID=A0A2G8SHG1_9APHY|nr:hypothetical protein GSI_04653 [Ganoderma sinense ZZ0214-1]
MQLHIIAAVLFSLLASAFAQTSQSFNTTLAYDPVYDNGNLSTTGITCSNGANGVICKNCALTLSQIPGWPNISGAPPISSWNSANCSTCWQLALPDFNTTINVRAVDASSNGFNVGFALMNAATNGQALSRGRVSAVARQIPDAGCEQGQQGPKQPAEDADCPPPGFGCS